MSTLALAGSPIRAATEATSASPGTPSCYGGNASAQPETTGREAVGVPGARHEPGQSDLSHDGGAVGRSSLGALVAICLAYFMVILDTTVVNIALPALGRGLGTTTTGLEWVVDSYSLVFAALLLSAGAAGDRRGAKGVFHAGVVVFSAASLACALTPSTDLLVAARCVQGLGAALAVPASLSLLAATNPTGRRVGGRSGSGAGWPASPRGQAPSSAGRSWRGSGGARCST